MTSSVSADNRVFQGRLFGNLRVKVRELVGRFLDRVMREEQMLFLGCVNYERTAVRRGYRNGSRERRLDTQWGPITLHVPKVRKTREPFRTRIFERYERRQGEMDALMESA